MWFSDGAIRTIVYKSAFISRVVYLQSPGSAVGVVNYALTGDIFLLYVARFIGGVVNYANDYKKVCSFVVCLVSLRHQTKCDF